MKLTLMLGSKLHFQSARSNWLVLGFCAIKTSQRGKKILSSVSGTVLSTYVLHNMILVGIQTTIYGCTHFLKWCSAIFARLWFIACMEYEKQLFHKLLFGLQTFLICTSVLGIYLINTTSVGKYPHFCRSKGRCTRLSSTGIKARIVNFLMWKLLLEMRKLNLETLKMHAHWPNTWS